MIAKLVLFGLVVVGIVVMAALGVRSALVVRRDRRAEYGEPTR